MNNGYGMYLAFMVLVAILIIILLFINAVRRKKIKADAAANDVSITGGNISVFFDNRKNVIIIPYVKDMHRNGRATGEVLSLSCPYKESDLGQLIRKGMRLCEGGTPARDTELMEKLGFAEWKKFSEGRRNISIHYQEGYGIVFNTTRRMADGAYHFNYNGMERSVSNHVSDRDLALTTLELLQHCRA